MPGTRRHGYVNAITSLAADNVERTAHAVDRLVENDIVLQRIGPGHVVIVGVFRPPDNSGGAVLRSGDSFELDLNKAVLDAGVVTQRQRGGCPTGRPEALPS